MCIVAHEQRFVFVASHEMTTVDDADDDVVDDDVDDDVDASAS